MRIHHSNRHQSHRSLSCLLTLFPLVFTSYVIYCFVPHLFLKVQDPWQLVDGCRGGGGWRGLFRRRGSSAYFRSHLSTYTAHLLTSLLTTTIPVNRSTWINCQSISLCWIMMSFHTYVEVLIGTTLPYCHPL